MGPLMLHRRIFLLLKYLVLFPESISVMLLSLSLRTNLLQPWYFAHGETASLLCEAFYLFHVW